MDPRDFFVTRGHAVALAASAGLFTCAVAVAALGRDPDADLIRSRVIPARLVLDSNPPPPPAPPDWSGIAASFSSATPPKGRGGYVMSLRTAVVPRLAGKPAKEEAKLLVLRPPAAPAVEAVPDRVTLTWKAAAKGSGDAAISEIRVLRQGPGDARPARVATLKPDATSWQDAAVKPRATYEYRLQFATKDRTVDGAAESAPSPVATIACPPGVDVRFKGGSTDRAILAVRRWADGAWTEETLMASPRSESADGVIGGVEVRGGKRVDRSTGFVLVAIRKETRRFTVPVEVSHLDANKLLVTEKVKREMKRESLRVEVIDDGGATRKLWQDDPLPEGAEPLTEDDR